MFISLCVSDPLMYFPFLSFYVVPGKKRQMMERMEEMKKQWTASEPVNC